MKIDRIVFALIATTTPALALASCGAAFGTVNSNWTTQSAASETGSMLDLRYEYIDQDQNYAGTSRVAFAQFARHHSERATRNRNLVVAWSHNFDSGFGLTVTAPLLDREHAHVHNHRGAQIDQYWNFRQLGDVRVLGRYQLLYADPLTSGGNPGLAYALTDDMQLYGFAWRRAGTHRTFC